MADTKISALTSASALTGTEEFAISDGTATSKAATSQQIKDFVETAPVFTAPTTSANTAPIFTDGTLMTTPQHGAMEHAGSALYFTPSATAGHRGILPTHFLIRADATRTFTSNTTSQAIFTNPTNGRITLDTGTYLFEGVLNFTSMSATSGNLLFNVLGAGTATCGSFLYHVVGVDGNTATAATQTGSTAVTSSTPASALTAGTGAAATLNIRGSFEVTAAGTMIPSITMVTAAASVLAIGSYLNFTRYGDNSLVSVGPWD